MRQKSWYLLLSVFVLGAVLVGCVYQMPTSPASAQQPEATADVEAATAAINEVWNQYGDSVNTGDLELWLSLWDDNGGRLAPDTPAVFGKEQIRAQMTIPFEQFTNKAVINNEEVEVAGDWAFSRGTYTLSITPKARGEETVIDGKYMTILKRQPDGSWKIYRDIHNSNVPPTLNEQDKMTGPMSVDETAAAFIDPSGKGTKQSVPNQLSDDDRRRLSTLQRTIETQIIEMNKIVSETLGQSVSVKPSVYIMSGSGTEKKADDELHVRECWCTWEACGCCEDPPGRCYEISTDY